MTAGSSTLSSKENARQNKALDEELLREIEQHFDQGGTSNTIGNPSARDPADPGDTEVQRAAISLDELNPDPSERAGEFLDFEEYSSSADEEQTQESIELDPDFDGKERESSEAVLPDTPPPVGRKRILLKRVLLAVLPLTLFALGAVSLVPMLQPKPEPPAPKFNVVRVPIPVILFKEPFTFIFLAQSQESRDLLRVELEVNLTGEPTRSVFVERKMELRDMIYTFLGAQRPVKSSSSQWQVIIEQSLLDFLRSSLPGCKIDSVVVVSFERV